MVIEMPNIKAVDKCPRSNSENISQKWSVMDLDDQEYFICDDCGWYKPITESDNHWYDCKEEQLNWIR